MEMSLEQFRESLVACGVLSDDELGDFEQSLSASGEKMPQSAAALAHSLVRNRKLTKYQAAHVYQNNDLPLVLGKYVIQDKIGAGGMGRVYKAHHRRLDRLVAIKLLPPDVVKSPAAVRRFHQEVKAAARLTHPNIVVTYDADEQDGFHYLVMEYVPGKDLASIVRKTGPLEIDLAVECAMQAAEGLAFAHDRGIVHRDVKPANLLLVRENPNNAAPTIKILDMGLARIASTAGTGEADDEGLTRTGQIMGSVDYMSPEQAMDTRAADQRSDVYSLGCTLYVLLGGKVPYYAKTLMKKLLAHREKPTPDVRGTRPDTPPQLAEVCLRMMAKQPADRPQTMRQVVELLSACRQASSSVSPPSSRPAPPPPRKSNEEVRLPTPNSLSPSSTPPPLAPPQIATAAPPRPLARPASSHPHDSPAQAISGNTAISVVADPTAVPSRTRRRGKPKSRGRSARPPVWIIGIAAGIALAGLGVVVLAVAAITWSFSGDRVADSAEGSGEHHDASDDANAAGDSDVASLAGGPIVLFDGSDLSHWRYRQAGWVIDEAEQAMVRGPVGGDIWTKEQYGNYILELQFKMTRACNSGVFLHASDITLPGGEQLEIQIADSADQDVGTRSCGAIYGVAGPDRAAAYPPGYWNRLKITARDDGLTIELNNQRIHYLHLDGFPRFRGKSRGYIGFQDHTGQVAYKNVRLTPLK